MTALFSSLFCRASRVKGGGSGQQRPAGQLSSFYSVCKSLKKSHFKVGIELIWIFAPKWIHLHQYISCAKIQTFYFAIQKEEILGMRHFCCDLKHCVIELLNNEVFRIWRWKKKLKLMEQKSLFKGFAGSLLSLKYLFFESLGTIWHQWRRCSRLQLGDQLAIS